MSEMDEKMPWRGIAKVTAMAAGAVFLAATGLARSEINEQRRQDEERKRYRWTDANRWDRD